MGRGFVHGLLLTFVFLSSLLRLESFCYLSSFIAPSVVSQNLCSLLSSFLSSLSLLLSLSLSLSLVLLFSCSLVLLFSCSTHTLEHAHKRKFLNMRTRKRRHMTNHTTTIIMNQHQCADANQTHSVSQEAPSHTRPQHVAVQDRTPARPSRPPCL